MFKVLIHKKSIKRLKEMEKSSLKKIANLIEMLEVNPIPWKYFDVKKIEGEKDTYRVRIGKYRIIYFVDRNNKIIHVLKIEKRGKAYK